MCVGEHAHATASMEVREQVHAVNSLSPSDFVWVLGTKFRSRALPGKCLTCEQCFKTTNKSSNCLNIASKDCLNVLCSNACHILGLYFELNNKTTAFKVRGYSIIRQKSVLVFIFQADVLNMFSDNTTQILYHQCICIVHEQILMLVVIYILYAT